MHGTLYVLGYVALTNCMHASGGERTVVDSLCLLEMETLFVPSEVELFALHEPRDFQPVNKASA